MTTEEHERTYRLDELATKAGVASRTVRYYVQRGLLPAPVFRGRDTAYDEGHLLRLRAIKALQERHLPLEEIAAVLSRGEGAAREVLEGRGPERDARVNDEAGDARARRRRASAHTPAGEGPRRCARFELAEGVELLVDEAVDEAGRALVEELLQSARKHRAKGSER